LLSNILLDELDKELENRGHRFCRYADDANIYVKSKRAGERVFCIHRGILVQTLKLRINREKSAVARYHERGFLGFSFTSGKTLKVKATESLWIGLRSGSGDYKAIPRDLADAG